MRTYPVTTQFMESVLSFIAGTGLGAGVCLTGGTALAKYYIGHRRSDDLDFFAKDVRSLESVSALILQMMADGVLDIYKEGFTDPWHKQFFLLKDCGEFKLEFFYTPLIHIEPFVDTEYKGLSVEPLPDLSAGKLYAFIDRDEPKDFIDLYFILTCTGIRLDSLINIAIARFPIPDRSPVNGYSVGYRLIACCEGEQKKHIEAMASKLLLSKDFTAKEMFSFMQGAGEKLLSDVFPLSSDRVGR